MGSTQTHPTHPHIPPQSSQRVWLSSFLPNHSVLVMQMWEIEEADPEQQPSDHITRYLTPLA